MKKLYENILSEMKETKKITEDAPDYAKKLVKEALEASSVNYPSKLYSGLSFVEKISNEEALTVLNNQLRSLEKEYEVLEDVCIGCKACTRTGCPAIVFQVDKKKSSIDPYKCVGCSVCAQVCPVDAIKLKGA